VKQQYDLQADVIEAVLARHGVWARVWEITDTPCRLRFMLTVPQDIRLRQVTSLGDELAMALHAAHAWVYRKNGIIRVEIPSDMRRVVQYQPLIREVNDIPPLTALLGIDDEGTPLLLPLADDNVAQVLVAGTTGSGKTSLLRIMALSLAAHNKPRDLQIVIIDHKRKLTALEGLPHLVAPPIVDRDVAGTVMARLVQLLDARIANNGRQGRKAPLVVFVDELADLLAISETEMEHAIVRLTSQGRSENIHLVLATQHPTANALNTTTKANLPCRIVFRVTDAHKASVATGVRDSGAEKLLGRGDGLVVFCGDTIRFQSAWVSDEDTRAEVRRISKGNGHSTPLPMTVDDGWQDTLRSTMNIKEASGGARKKPIPQDYIDAVVKAWLQKYRRLGGNIIDAQPAMRQVRGPIHYNLYEHGTNTDRANAVLELAREQVLREVQGAAA